VTAQFSGRSLTGIACPPILEGIRTLRPLCHSLRARLFAATLLLPLLALATVTSAAGLRCRLTGAVLSACCCDRDSEPVAKAASVATVSEADCCERLVRDVTTSLAEVCPASSALPDQAMPVAFVAFEPSALDLVSSALSSRSETRTSLALPTVRLRLVAKSSFLI
jgi:hypothetical protein